MSAMDRLINWLDPVRGMKRYRARAITAMSGNWISGGYSARAYNAVDRTRRANQLGNKPELDAGSAILGDLSSLRSASQDMYRNNAVACGALNINVTKVVGRGLRAKANIDRQFLGLHDAAAEEWEQQAEREFQLATETREIDAERCHDFAGLQALAFLKTLEDGDVLVNLPRFARPGSPYLFKIQLIEAARLCNREGKADSERMVGGISIDQYGAPERFHVANRHPGNLRGFLAGAHQKMTWSDLAAFDTQGNPLALLLFDKRRPGQPRGVPYLAPVLENIKQLGRYTEAELMAAVVYGMLTVFITSESEQAADIGPAPNPANPDGERMKQDDTTGLEMGYGTVMALGKGEKPLAINAARPNTGFDSFVASICKQIGMGLELPYEVLLRSFNASYSASRAALEEAWGYFQRRRQWLVTSFCQPVWEGILTEAVARGRLSAPGFFADPAIRRAWLRASWEGETQAQLDPVKEVDAAEKRIALKLTTRSEERANLVGGTAWEDMMPHYRREQELVGEVDNITAHAGLIVPAQEKE